MPSERREAARIRVGEHRLSIARAYRAARLSRAAYYRQGIDWAKRDAPVVDALNGVVEQHRRWGFWKCFDQARVPRLLQAGVESVLRVTMVHARG
jgi:putative transposase